MSTNTLVNKIAADAEARVLAIQEAATTEVAAIARETDATLERMRAESAVQLAKKQAQQELVATSKARQAGKLLLQSAKRTALDAVFADAYAALVALETEAYVALFTAQTTNVLGGDVAVRQVTAPANRLTETKAVLAKVGITAEVVSNDALDAGLIITAEGGVYDVSLARIFALKRPELEMSVIAVVTK